MEFCVDCLREISAGAIGFPVRDPATVNIEILIARWVAVLWIVFGVSHFLYPRQWAEIFGPLREKETGGLMIAAYNFPLGLIIILGHNVWVWDIPALITVAGWLTTLKSIAYALHPRAHVALMGSAERLKTGFRAVGLVLILLGAITGYDAFFRR